MIASLLLWSAAPTLAMPWQDPVTHRAPSQGYAQVSSTALLRRDVVSLSTLRMGTPLVSGDRLSFGASIDVSAQALFAADGRRTVAPQNVGGRLSLTFVRPDGDTSYSWWLDLQGSPQLTSWFLHDPNDNGTALSGGYTGYVEKGRTKLLMEFSLGTGTEIPVSYRATFVALRELSDRVAVGLGATALMPSALATVRVRPTADLEIGADLGLSIWAFEGVPFPEPLTLYPSLQVVYAPGQ